MAELESRCEALEESQRHSLTEQLSRMSAENLQLRDRTDELSAEIELLRGQLAAARFFFLLSAFSLFYCLINDNASLTLWLICLIRCIRTECVGLGPAWRSEPTMSGAVKRRNGEEEELGVEDHAGKVRKKEAGTGHCSSEESPRPLSDNQVCVSPSSGRLQLRASPKELVDDLILFYFSSWYSIGAERMERRRKQCE